LCVFVLALVEGATYAILTDRLINWPVLHSSYVVQAQARRVHHSLFITDLHAAALATLRLPRAKRRA